MKSYKIVELLMAFPASEEESEKMRSDAQNLQLENQELFKKIKDNNEKIESIISQINHGSTKRYVKAIDEYDAETGTITTYYNGYPMETKLMEESERLSILSKVSKLEEGPRTESISPKTETPPHYPTVTHVTPDPMPEIGYHLEEKIDPEYDESLSII